MSDDPFSPDYSPSGGRQTAADPGSGELFGVDLFALYRAGYVYLPEVAQDYSGAVSEVHAAGGHAEAMAAMRPAEGSLRKLVAVLDQVQGAMHESATNLHLTGEALVRIADTYVRTDEAAAAEFVLTKADLAGLDPADFSQPPVPFENPPLPTDPTLEAGPRRPWHGPA